MTQLTRTGTATAFDLDASVVAVTGGWQATVSDRWNIAGNPNGGYLLALLGRAMGEATGRPDPLTLTAQYLTPTVPGAAEITVEILKQSRSYATVSAALLQDGAERIRATGTYGDLGGLAGPTMRGPEPSPFPPPQDLPDLRSHPGPDGGPAPEIFEMFDVRLDPWLGWPRGERGGRNEISGWIRFADGRAPDVTSLPLFADALPPAVLDLIPARWVPTISLNVMVRGRPAPGWLRATFRTRTVVGGTIEEDGEIWDESGQLVAISRQLAVVLPPAP